MSGGASSRHLTIISQPSDRELQTNSNCLLETVMETNISDDNMVVFHEQVKYFKGIFIYKLKAWFFPRNHNENIF